MIKTLNVLIFKFIMVLIAAIIAFRFIDTNTWGWVIIVTLAVTILNYLLGDLLLLSRFGSAVVIVFEGILGILAAHILDLYIPAFHTAYLSLVVFGIVIMVTEYFFHAILRRMGKVFP